MFSTMATTTKKNKNFLFLGGKDKVTPLPSSTSSSTTLQFEFDEADIWSHNNSEETSNKLSIPSSRFSRKNTRKGGEKRVVNNATSSLPVNVPDWRKILGGDHDDDKGSFGRNLVCDFDDVDDDGDFESNKDDEYYRIPPHEYLARTRVASFSVHEGIGRTLKGRDLSRVRNAIWKKIGFED